MGTIAETSMRRLIPFAALTAALAGAPALWAQTPQQDSAAHRTWNVPGTTPTTTTNPTTPPTTSNPTTSTSQARAQIVADTAFIREVRTDNQVEIRLGNVAEKRASNSAVKQFAQKMVSDHTTLNNQWGSVATRNGLTAPANLDAAQQQLVSRLSSLSGAEFDREYMGSMVQAHQEAVATFQRLGPSAQSPEVRQLASSGLPILQQHLTMAQQVANEVGASVATGGKVPTGAVASDKNGGTGVKADQDFVAEVVQGHDMEVQLADIERQKGKDAKVKDFAGNVRNDFKDYGDRWHNIASNNKLTVPAHLGHLHQDKVDRLKSASGNQVDRVYLDIVRETVGSMVPYYQKEGRQSQSGQVRNLAENELPMLQRHLSRSEDLSHQTTANASDQDKDKDKDKDKAKDKSLSNTNK
jgi:putative membrane protein